EPFAPGNAALPRYWSLGIEVEAISPDAGMWRETSGGMAVFVGSGRPAVRVGDRVQFLARLRRNRRPSNPGERDRARTYERRGSYGAASVQSPAALRVLSRGRWHGSLRYAVAGARSFVRARLARHLSAEGPEGRWALVAALLFGERNWLTPAQERLLKESGTLHFLAISGLHVGLFCVFVAYVLTLADLPVRPRYAATIALVWLYVWFTGAHVSALRAGWMLTFMLAAPLLGRRGDSTSALAGAALVILLFSPQQLFAPGFQLTFAAVWAMIAIYPQLAGILWPWEDLLAELSSPQQRSLWTDLWLGARSFLLLSLTIWVATAPIRAYHFHSLCLFAPLLNLLMWPLVLLLLLTCFALAGTALLGGLGTAALASVAQFWSGRIETLLRAASGLPGFGVYVSAPPLWWAALFYVALAAWVLRERLPGRRAAFVGAALALGLGYVGAEAAARWGRPFRFTVADVGTGQAALARLPGGEAVLFDAGAFGAGRATAVAEMLWADRVRRIEGVVLSHLNSDHCNFLPFLSERFELEQVAFPASALRDGLAGRARRWLGRQPFRLKRLSEGASVRGGRLRCEVLHPNARFAAEPSIRRNDRSLVLLCRWGALSLLLPGDIETAGIRRLCRDYGGRLRADVLVMPHHGRYHVGLAELVEVVGPAAAIVSGPEAHCDPRTRAILRERGVPLWITGRDGAIIVTFERGEASVRGFRSGRSLRFRPGAAAAAREGEGR
ncbi:MAG: ComEC/Rec2 family competence protein, partial [Planctomycetota bacterium]